MACETSCVAALVAITVRRSIVVRMKKMSIVGPETPTPTVKAPATSPHTSACDGREASRCRRWTGNQTRIGISPIAIETTTMFGV